MSSNNASSENNILDRNIASLAAYRANQQSTVSLQHRLISQIGSLTGSLSFVYLHVVIIAIWLVLSTHNGPLAPFSASFNTLTGLASIEALFLTSFVLISQKRMTELADKRADLNLQISLLAEHETTRILVIVNSIARDMNLKSADHPSLKELQKMINPEHVLAKIDEEQKRAINPSSTEPPPSSA